MARKRYLSTKISIDSRVRQLAEANEFAALLYTWMIPHASDDGTISSDPEELMMQVVPGFRWRTVEDVRGALALMVQLGLLLPEDDRLRFPKRSFYGYQSYISDSRRPADDDPEPSGPQRKTAQNGAVRESASDSAQNTPSVKSSSSLIKSPNGDMSASDEQDANDPVVDGQVDQVYARYKAQVQPLSRLCPRKKIAARLKRFSVDELQRGIDNFAADPWWMSNNAARGAAWFFESDDRAEQFLLLQPRPAPVLAFAGQSNAPPEPPPEDNTGKGIWR